MKTMVFVACLCFLALYASAQGESKEKSFKIPPGMEIKKVEGYNIDVLVPEGANVYPEGSQLHIEPYDEYAARKFLEMNSRFSGIESEIEALKTEISALKDAVERLEKKTLSSQER